MVHLQHRAVRQAVAPAHLFDQGFTDDLFLQLHKQVFVDAALDLLPRQPPCGLEAEDIVGAAAGQRFLPDAHRGLHADIALPHGELFLKGQPLRPAGHHPFAFDLHSVLFLPQNFVFILPYFYVMIKSRTSIILRILS